MGRKRMLENSHGDVKKIGAHDEGLQKDDSNSKLETGTSSKVLAGNIRLAILPNILILHNESSSGQAISEATVNLSTFHGTFMGIAS